MPHSCHNTGRNTLPTRGDDDDDDHDHGTSGMKAPTVDSGKSSDRLNPPVEYDVLELGDLEPDELKTKLNELGAEGWLLLSTSPAFIFRRVKKTEEEKKKGRVGFGVSK